MQTHICEESVLTHWQILLDAYPKSWHLVSRWTFHVISRMFSIPLLTCKYFPFSHTYGLYCLQNDSLNSWIPPNFSHQSCLSPQPQYDISNTLLNISTWKDKFNMAKLISLSPSKPVAPVVIHISIKGTIRYLFFQPPNLEIIHVFLYHTSHPTHP